MSDKPVERKELTPFNQFKYDLKSMVEKSSAALPRDINADRLRINAMMYVTEDKKLYQLACEQPAKIAQIIFNFIALGLDMLNRECYIIPYNGKLQVLKDYKGEVKLVKKYAIDPIREIYARVVYAQDKYYFDEENKFIHEFDPFKVDRGDKIGAFCTVIYQNGVQQTEFVNIEEIEKVKSVSQSAKSEYSPWQKWEDEMFKKTVIRKAMKNISLDFGNNELQAAYKNTDNDVDFNSRQNDDEILNQPEPDIPSNATKEEIIDIVEDKVNPKDNNIKEVDLNAI